MADSIVITASLRIERPADVVRDQYRDIDHHIRNNVHPSIQYQWEPSAPGERRIRTTFRVLGVPQYDVSVLEDRADGAFVIRYLEGTNAGMVLVHEFVPLGADATDVRLTADAPATLSRRLLGPLFVAGGRQVMRKALAEDKRDLEGGRFVPGRASGNIEAALSFMRPPAGGGPSFVRPFTERSPEARHAVLDAALLVGVADGHVDPNEVDAIARLARIIGASDPREWIAGRANEHATSTRIVEDAQRVGEELVRQGVGLEGITSAVVVALVSGGMTLGELELLRALARVAQVPDGSLPLVIDRAEQALGAA